MQGLVQYLVYFLISHWQARKLNWVKRVIFFCTVLLNCTFVFLLYAPWKRDFPKYFKKHSFERSFNGIPSCRTVPYHSLHYNLWLWIKIHIPQRFYRVHFPRSADELSALAGADRTHCRHPAASKLRARCPRNWHPKVTSAPRPYPLPPSSCLEAAQK